VTRSGDTDIAPIRPRLLRRSGRSDRSDAADLVDDLIRQVESGATPAAHSSPSRSTKRGSGPSAPAPAEAPTPRVIRSYDPASDLDEYLNCIYALLSVPPIDTPLEGPTR
jgi:hypothetical protein